MNGAHNTRTLAYTIAAVCLLAVVTIAGAGAGVVVADANTTESTEQTELTTDSELVGERGYTIDELQQRGDTYENSPDGVRISGDRMYWLIHWPGDSLFANPGDTNDPNWEYLGDGQLVDRNSVWLRSINTQGTEEVDVTVVSYVEQQTENGTGTIPVNVTERTHTVELEAGWSMAEVDLPRTDDRKQVSIWVEDDPADLRWNVEHESLATTQPMLITTWGGFIYQAFMVFLGPILFGSLFVGAGGKKVIDRAKVGPNWGMLQWGLVISIGSMILLWFYFDSIAELVVAAPFVLAAGIVGLFGIILIENYSADTYTAEFVRPNLTDAQSPTGDDIKDVVSVQSQEETLVRTGVEGLAVVRKGMLPFLSRCFGGAANLEGAAAVDTHVAAESGEMDYKFYVSQDADDVLDYRPEGWKIELPELEIPDELSDRPEPLTTSEWLGLAANQYGVPAFGGLLLFGMMWMAFSPMWALASGVLLMGAATVRPRDGYARFEPATVHERTAYTSMLYLERDEVEAQTIQELMKKIPELETRALRERFELLDEQDATMVEETFGLEGIDRDTNGGLMINKGSDDDSDREADEQEARR